MDFLYPTLVDPSSPSDNFDEVGSNAQLFLVASRCAGVLTNAAGALECSPFDDDGVLNRDLVRVPIAFV
jgi:hypothetical protein